MFRPRWIRTRRTLQARIVVDNPGEKLKKDMYCTVTVTAGTLANAIAVPDASVLRDDNNEPFVYCRQRQTSLAGAMWNSVRRKTARHRFSRDISVGDRVVGNGSLFLQFANSLQH